MPFEFYSMIWPSSCTKSLRVHSLEQQRRQNESRICLKMRFLLSNAKWLKIALVARMSISIVLLQRHICGSEPILANLTSAFACLAHLDRQKSMFWQQLRIAYFFESNDNIFLTLKLQFGAMPTDKLWICIGNMWTSLRWLQSFCVLLPLRTSPGATPSDDFHTFRKLKLELQLCTWQKAS